MAYPNQVNLWDLQKRKFEGAGDTPDYMRQADVYAQEKEDAYQEALKGVPDEPNPSVWRRLAAGALGAFGGYHSQFVDPRQTEGAVQTVLQGDYPMRYKKAQEAIKRAETGVTLADRLRQRANQRYQIETASKDRNAAEELRKAEGERQAALQYERGIGSRGRQVMDEDLKDPAMQDDIKRGRIYLSTSPDGRTFAIETPSYQREQQAAAKLAQIQADQEARNERAAQDRASREGMAADRNAVMLAIAGMRKTGQDATDKLGMRLDADEKKRKAAASKSLWDDYGRRHNDKLNTLKKAQLDAAAGKFSKEELPALEASVMADIERDLEQTRLRDASTWDLTPEQYEAHAATIRPGVKAAPAQKAAEPKAAAGGSDTVMVRNPQGVTGVIPRAQLAAAKAQGYTEVK